MECIGAGALLEEAAHSGGRLEVGKQGILFINPDLPAHSVPGL